MLSSVRATSIFFEADLTKNSMKYSHRSRDALITSGVTVWFQDGQNARAALSERRAQDIFSKIY